MHPPPITVLTIDAALLLLAAALVVVLLVREYAHSSWYVRLPIGIFGFFSLATALHLFGLRYPAVDWLFWPRLGLDTTIDIAIICRLIYNHFVPRPKPDINYGAKTDLQN